VPLVGDRNAVVMMFSLGGLATRASVPAVTTNGNGPVLRGRARAGDLRCAAWRNAGLRFRGCLSQRQLGLLLKRRLWLCVGCCCGCLPIDITTTTLPGGVTGSAYSETLSITGGISLCLYGDCGIAPGRAFDLSCDDQRDAERRGRLKLHRFLHRLADCDARHAGA
jgi:hypothetical protein